MNTTVKRMSSSRALIAAAVASALLAACSAAPVKPAGSEAVRNKLTQLQSDPNLASRAPIAIKEADVAVTAAEVIQPDEELAAHRVYIAERKVDTATAQAQTRYAEDQRAQISQERDTARLAARTREVETAQAAAADARGDADAARIAAVSSEQEAMELQRRIAELQAEVTDRGLVLTLGDVLFATGRAELKEGATGNLNKLIEFLNTYPKRTVMIEGYTDAVGSDEANQGLSERRAEAVRSYLVGQGISATRLTASGKGESRPVADNDSAAGRQQNRRVEVVIDNPATAPR